MSRAARRVGLALLALAALGGLGWWRVSQLAGPPATAFSPATAPPAPDYASQDDWAALPWREDLADVVPPDAGLHDAQATAETDVFFVYPTTYFLGRTWNAAIDDPLANWMTDRGILTQQASVFNGTARIFAPRYRQVSLVGQSQRVRPEDRAAALALAYHDVEAAFDHYLDHWNEGRPFFIASHSQGTTHAQPLLNHLFAKRPDAAKRLVAAYLIGNTVIAAKLPSALPACDAPSQTGCFVSWNAIAEGGDDRHWRAKGEPACVNPLSWRANDEPVGADANLGGIPLVGPLGLSAPDPHLTGARCERGILRITPPRSRGYSLALYEGGGYHAYDYNLFWMNLRENIARRAAAFADRPARTVLNPARGGE
jgi:hypothetical protein